MLAYLDVPITIVVSGDFSVGVSLQNERDVHYLADPKLPLALTRGSRSNFPSHKASLFQSCLTCKLVPELVPGPALPYGWRGWSWADLLDVNLQLLADSIELGDVLLSKLPGDRAVQFVLDSLGIDVP